MNVRADLCSCQPLSCYTSGRPFHRRDMHRNGAWKASMEGFPGLFLCADVVCMHYKKRPGFPMDVYRGRIYVDDVVKPANC